MGVLCVCVCVCTKIMIIEESIGIVGGSGKNWKGEKECKWDVHSCIEF